LEGIGAVLRAQGKHSQALEDYQRASTILEKGLGPQHPTVAHALTEIGRSYQARGEPSKAIVPLERALSIYEARPAEPSDLAEARFALARALGRDGEHRQRAMLLASSARDIFAAAGPVHHEDVSAVDAWLAGKWRARR